MTQISSPIFAPDLSKTFFLLTLPKTVTLIDRGPFVVSPPMSSALYSLQQAKNPRENFLSHSLFDFGRAIESKANIGEAPIDRISETLTAIAFHPSL